ncbi:MAG: oligosaccharide flippase family protein [Vicinamibacterales bacterium]
MTEERPSLQGLDGLRRLWKSSRRSLIGASAVVAQPLLLNAVSIPATYYIISSLGPEQYGEWSIALSLLAATSVLVGLGTRLAFVRSISRDPSRAATLFAEQLGLRALLGTLAGTVSVLACLALGYPTVVLQATLLLVFGGVFSAITGVVSDLLTALERLPSMSAVTAVGGLVLTCSSVIAIWLGAGPVGLGMSYIIGPILTAMLALSLVHRQLFPVRAVFAPARWKTLLVESKMLSLQFIVIGLDTQAVNLLLPKFVGVTEYGYFAAGTLLPARLLVVPDGLNTAFYPVLVRAFGEGTASFRSAAQRFYLLAVAVGLATAVPVFALAGPIARLLFPHQPEICRQIIEVTIWWVPLLALHMAATNILNASFRDSREARLSVMAVIVSLATTVLLVSSLGLIGAALSLLAKGTINLAFRVPLVLEALREPDPTRARAAAASTSPEV